MSRLAPRIEAPRSLYEKLSDSMKLYDADMKQLYPGDEDSMRLPTYPESYESNRVKPMFWVQV